jgi:hypothetical protein
LARFLEFTEIFVPLLRLFVDLVVACLVAGAPLSSKRLLFLCKVGKPQKNAVNVCQ